MEGRERGRWRKRGRDGELVWTKHARHIVGPQKYLSRECLVPRPHRRTYKLRTEDSGRGCASLLAVIPERQMLTPLHCVISEHRCVETDTKANLFKYQRLSPAPQGGRIAK